MSTIIRGIFSYTRVRCPGSGERVQATASSSRGTVSCSLHVAVRVPTVVTLARACRTVIGPI